MLSTIVNNNTGYCISLISLGTIYNSTNCEATHYGAFTNLSTLVTPGTTQTIHLASSAAQSHFSVYVDWNDNSILGDDPSELVMDNLIVQPTIYGGTYGTFTIPVNAVLEITTCELSVIFMGIQFQIHV
ncbi:MAG: hypothetical protein IPP27_02565 [Bacteroidetes bacterium]|nr:hypothetical protein [Bacteroidota bacterium]